MIFFMFKVKLLIQSMQILHTGMYVAQDKNSIYNF